MKELCTVHCLEFAYLFAENLFYRCESGLEYLHPPGAPESCGKNQASFASAHARLRDGGHGIARLSLVRQVEWGGAPCSWCGWQLRSISWVSKLKDGNVGPPILLMDV